MKEVGMAEITQWLDSGYERHQDGDLMLAEPYYKKILDVQPEHFKALYLLGSLNVQQGNHLDALRYLTKALELKPNYSRTHNSVGLALSGLQKYEQAVNFFSQAIQLDNNYTEAYFNMGEVLNSLGQSEHAVTVFECVIGINPEYYQAYIKLGNTCKRLGQISKAEYHLRKAIEIKPQVPDGYYLLGLVMECDGRLDEAIKNYTQTLELNPDLKAARWNRALLWLLQGEFEKGWPDYDLGFDMHERPQRQYDKPAWDGSDAPDKTILVWAEQGYGDTFQFVRYLPQVKAVFGRLIFEAPPNTLRLLTEIQGIDEIVEAGQTPVDEFDYHIPLLGLPAVFKTQLSSIPNEIPYVHAVNDDIKRWHGIIPDSDQFKVGIVWSGNTLFKANVPRSCTLNDFSILADIPEVKFYSLQVGDAAGQLAGQAQQLPAGMSIVDLGQQLTSFADTAAVMQQLDLIITVDTAVAHLAGAMGRPVWTLLQYVPDWRWLMHGQNCPWYPGMRLFRQPRRADWGSVFKSVKHALNEAMQDRN